MRAMTAVGVVFVVLLGVGGCAGPPPASPPPPAPQPASAPGAPSAGSSAVARMSADGPEGEALRSQVGDWDMVATMWPDAGAPPVVTRGLIAKREMVGAFLQETLAPAPGSDVPPFTRLDYLNFDRVEGRWKYVSMDTRFPVSIMPASSFGPAADGKIALGFQPLAFVGFGSQVEGRYLSSDMIVSQPDADHGLKQQHALMATGDGKPWLFVQYEYTRRR